MFAKTAEKRMRIVRGVLALGWLVLIASLLWDPYSIELTRPDNLGSPFHIRQTAITVQGQFLQQTPYAMGNRIFWTMLIPLLPLFLMLAGHEAWRRICPLSFLSQIPRYLGIQRKKSVLIRRSGQIERQLALVNKDGWVKKHVWALQFGLLFLALNARILLVNADRTALAIMLLAIILAAISVGYLWGGKTWCNYVCPVGIVQKIYTEPRGLLESRPHVERQAITQSMCRTSTDQGERSICVGCTSHCPDIDLERSYWENIHDPLIRHVYYCFFGLVIGFYAYFYIYSGNWDYYFSGAWTHEDNLLGQLLSPGLYIVDHSIAIPKILAVPLVLSIFVILGLCTGKFLEYLYRQFLHLRKSALTEPEIINRCLSFSAFVTINVFYIFGGRSNINLLPAPAIRCLDFFIICVTVLWFLRAIQRSPTHYRRESLASSLLNQLRQLKIDIARYVETPNIEQLSPDEIYVLAKTLPEFSNEQRLLAYRNILFDAIKTGRTDGMDSFERMRELRLELGVGDDEHHRLLEELGIDRQSATYNAQKFPSYEQWLRHDNFKLAIETLIIHEMEKGIPLTDILAQEDLALNIKNASEIYQISTDEQAHILAEISGQSGIIFERASHQLDKLAEHCSNRFTLDAHARGNPQWQDIQRVLDTVLLRRANIISLRLCSILRTLGDTQESHWLASSMENLMGEQLEKNLNCKINSESHLTYAEALHPHIVHILCGEIVQASGNQSTRNSLPPPIKFHTLLDKAPTVEQVLFHLLVDDDALVVAVALNGLSYLNLTQARQQAHALQTKVQTEKNSILVEVCETILGTSRSSPTSQQNKQQNSQQNAGLRLSLNDQTYREFYKEYVSIGRANNNDFVIHHPAICPHHVCLYKEAGQVWLKRLDPFAWISINGNLLSNEAQVISNGSALGFVTQGQSGPVIFLEWRDNKTDYELEQFDTISKLLWLSAAGIFQSLDLHTIAQLAQAAEVRLYRQSSYLCRAGEVSRDAYLLQSGTAQALLEGENENNNGDKHSILNQIDTGSIVGELGVITSRPRSVSVRISSAHARIVTINGERLHSLMRQDPLISLGILKIVANYVQH
ncbi:cyclic nucleotide-binding domain-containing protein [Undibacterium flavidum]|uniref:Cyclic nucleotide-binding domain-containing protein n=1 Tax=Undibacterium flavidum TaxID=2762297 RepID=A0ABR6Y7N1_9BURK|nr:cyclic nucleotide-binding domain-containing protein [Undibacterium flavidum]MBC3872603.1 cyclic nucleotide-binding domain-containing protein [Undibacterium flavidum]